MQSWAAGRLTRLPLGINVDSSHYGTKTLLLGWRTYMTSDRAVGDWLDLCVNNSLFYIYIFFF
jgi:hypothetical protein